MLPGIWAKAEVAFYRPLVAERWTAVIDDRSARHCAQGLGVLTVGTLGVLVVAKKEGRLDKVEPAIEQLRRAGLHVGDAVVEQILRMAGES